jgi:hypothetical protein
VRYLVPVCGDGCARYSGTVLVPVVRATELQLYGSTYRYRYTLAAHAATLLHTASTAASHSRLDHGRS